MKIGFIGTGVMGAPMAAHILSGGYSLAVYNRTKDKARPLIEGGAVWMDSVAALSAWADAVITMVSYPRDVEALYFGAEGILENARPDTYVVDMTTSSPLLARKIHAAAKERGLHALDAPVTGGDVGAQKATLTIMVGGDREAFEAMKGVFSRMGKSIVYIGSPGAGQECKLCNQICVAGNIMGACESLAYAKKAGLDVQTVLDVLVSGGAASWQLSVNAPRMLANDFAPGFFVKHFVKDMDIALDEAQGCSLDLPALSLAKSLFDRLVAHDMADCGTQALYQLYLGLDNEKAGGQ